ncbi:MAG: glycoside hydrolase family 28 protein [Phocaeicola sp.]
MAIKLFSKHLLFPCAVALLALLSISCSSHSVAAKEYSHLYKNLPFEMPLLTAPTFPATTVSLHECGGVADGRTLNTDAFEAAMSQLSSRGGGKLVVPSGVWLTGPITFRSNINLHLEKGALILFTPDFDQYPLVSTSFEGEETRRCQSPISGRNLENIAITGQGAINGSGGAWRPVKRIKMTNHQWGALVKSGGFVKNDNLWLPTAKALKGDSTQINKRQVPLTDAEWDSIKDYLRPVMISFIECKNLLLEGVLFENSPSWNIHPLMCENVIIDGITVRNPSFAQNGDGLDLESCRNAIIVNSSFDVGDDAICIKSGKDEDGRRRNRPTENVIVENCRVFKGHGGFVVGSEMSGSVRNIAVNNCQFMGTNIGLRFKSARGRGGVVENIYISNINMFDMVHEPLSISTYYFTKKSDSIPPVDETTPVFRNIYIKDIVARNGSKAISITGLAEMHVQNIVVENATITATEGVEISEATGITLTNVAVYPERGEALTLDNVKELTITGGNL